jgi:4,5:9,10-diseco-3-hydroxy-5,9,17-trioxoandrosta-1(10),2-diene-4-oate hydrolase
MERARTALGAGPKASFLLLDGLRLAYSDEGDGPAVLCLHSIAHGARDFEALREGLRSRYRVIALDWPGHGASDDDTEPASAARYAELLARFVSALGLRGVALVGNSIGGAAALAYASSRPESVRALVLVDSGGLVRVGAAARLLTGAMARFFAAGARGARWFPRAFALYYRAVLPAAPAREQRARIVAAARESAAVLAAAWASFGRRDADLREAAAGLACPVLAAWAKSDRVIPLALVRPALRRIPDVELATFPGGHSPFLECPERFLPVLERFLARALASP